MVPRHHRFSGLISKNDPLHYVLGNREPFPPKDSIGRRLAPAYVVVPGLGKQIPKWGPTKRDKVDGFRPALDCGGNFMAYRFQTNNNCYNYACNIATNSFAQPGRRHGKDLTLKGKSMKGSDVIEAAEADGITLIGGKDMKLRQAIRSQAYDRGRAREHGGHLVALLISTAVSDIRWAGDYHWVRCDDALGKIWSQKDGPDHVTDYDFGGEKIIDPSKACWVSNTGPPPTGWGRRKHRLSSQVVEYYFAAWMFVSYKHVSII
ncbi:hypothetical protein BH10ACI4_BH10ACI4_11600 [soil metagenome]